MDNEKAEVIVDEEIIDSTDDSEKDQEIIQDDNDTDDNTEELEEETTPSEEDDEDSEDVITIGDEESPTQDEEHDNKPAPSWVKELRKTNRELKKQNRDLEEKVRAVSGVEDKATELGKKPTLEDSEFDTEQYERDLSSWFDRKRQVDEQQAKQKAEQENQQKEWQDRLTSYNESKTKLKVKDHDEAEFAAQEKLSHTQQGMIIQGADNPALVMYALGKNSKKLEEISNIKDPVKFAFTVSKLETQLKVTSKKRPTTAPERKVKSTSSGSSIVDSTLERLRDEAHRTGNTDKLMQYKRSLKK